MIPFPAADRSFVRDTLSVAAPHTGSSTLVKSSWVPLGFRLIAVGLAAIHTAVAVNQQSMSEDGINYLDLGGAYLNGDWGNALNPIWSPLYPLILGTVLHVVRPSVWWEFPIVQLTNFVIFVGTLACFEFFWRRLGAVYYERTGEAGAPVRFQSPLWVVIGYSLFIWASLSLITVWRVTPDMLVAACVYLAGGLLCQLSRTRTPARDAAVLGTVLGLGYLAKGVLLPLGIVFVLLSCLVRTRLLGNTKRLGIVAAAFALVAGPFIAALSWQAGHPTVGEVGRFTYMKHVNGLRYPDWAGSLALVSGTPDNPPRRIFQDPNVYEFAEPIGGTYPLAFNPGYWTRGLSPHLDTGQQGRVLLSNATFFFDFFVRAQGGFVAIVVLMLMLTWSTRGRTSVASPQIVLVCWAVCAFGLYALVYAESRYIAPFVLIFWSGLLACVSLPDTIEHRRLLAATATVLVGALWVNIAAFNLAGFAQVFNAPDRAVVSAAPASENARRPASPRPTHPRVAEGLLRLGITPGDRVALIGDPWTAFWARLARVRIAAEILPPADRNAFWHVPAERRQAVLDAFARAGVRAVVAEPAVGATVWSGWRPVGDTGYLVFFLP